MVGVSSRGLAVGEIGLVDIYHLVICRWASRRANTWLFLCIWQIEKRKEKKRGNLFLIGVPHRERNLRGHEIVRYEEVVREVMVDDGTGNGASHILLAHHSRYRM